MQAMTDTPTVYSLTRPHHHVRATDLATKLDVAKVFASQGSVRALAAAITVLVSARGALAGFGLGDLVAPVVSIAIVGRSSGSSTGTSCTPRPMPGPRGCSASAPATGSTTSARSSCGGCMLSWSEATHLRRPLRRRHSGLGVAADVGDRRRRSSARSSRRGPAPPSGCSTTSGCTCSCTAGTGPTSRHYARLARHHRLHHFRNEHHWFGITSISGDRLMHTAPRHPGDVELSPTARTLGVAVDDHHVSSGNRHTAR